MTMSCFGRVPVFAGARGIDVVAQASDGYQGVRLAAELTPI